MGLGHIVTGTRLYESIYMIGIVSLMILLIVSAAIVRHVREYLYYRQK